MCMNLHPKHIPERVSVISIPSREAILTLPSSQLITGLENQRCVCALNDQMAFLPFFFPPYSFANRFTFENVLQW